MSSVLGTKKKSVTTCISSAAAETTAHFCDHKRTQPESHRSHREVEGKLLSGGLWGKIWRARASGPGWAQRKSCGEESKKPGQDWTVKLLRLWDWMGTGLSTTLPGRSECDLILSTRKWRNCFKPSNDLKMSLRRQPKSVAKVGSKSWSPNKCALDESTAEMRVVYAFRCWLQPGWTLVMWLDS